MHDEILSEKQKSALAVLTAQSAVQTFYLAGGTALALHLGHRESFDLDFFRQESFDPQWLLAQLPVPPPVRVLQEARDTLTVEFQGVKTGFFGYPHALIKPTEMLKQTRVASVEDIAAMKLAAIAGRGARRGFIDIYFICKRPFPLREAFACLQAKYAEHEYDLYHILRSLTYFEDAEAEPMPLLHQQVSWEHIKGFFKLETSRLRV